MYKSLAEIIESANMSGKEFWEVVLEEDIKERNITFDEVHSIVNRHPCSYGTAWAVNI